MRINVGWARFFAHHFHPASSKNNHSANNLELFRWAKKRAHPTTILLVLCCFCSSIAIAGVKIDHWQTTQGAKVFYVQSQSLPLVDIEVSFDAGSARDGKQSGLAALTAAVLNTSAGKWSADEVAQRFDSVGAQFNIEANIDSVSLSLRSLTEPALLNKALETMQAVLTQPRFSAADFQREKNNALAALKEREESPADLADLAFNKAVFGEHPYATPTLGYQNTVANFKAQELKQFYQQYYVAANAVIVIVGNLDKPQAQQTAEKLFQGLAKGQKAAPLPEVKLPEKANTQAINFPSSQTHLLIGMPGITRKDNDFIPLYVGNHILGGSGMVSKLFDEVREKRGLVYSVYSYFSPMIKPGLFTIGLQTKNAQTQQALQVVNEMVSQFINNGVTEAELIAAKKNITGGFVLRSDTNSKLTHYITLIGFQDLPLDYLDTFTQRVEAVTVEQIKDAFKRRIKPDLFQTITVGGNPKEK